MNAFEVNIDVRGHMSASARVLGCVRIVSQEVNRGYKGIGGAFMRRIGKNIQSAGIDTKRGKRKAGGKQPSVPKAARAMGMTAKISGLGKIDEKTLVMGTRTSGNEANEMAMAHEAGAVIRPKPGSFLPIRKKQGGGRKKSIVATVGPGRKTQEVRIKPRLGFGSSWQQFQGEFRGRISKMWDRVERRI